MTMTARRTAEEYKQAGNAAFAKHDLDSALAHFTTAIHLDPATAAYPLNRAAVYLKLRDWTRAERDATTALQLDGGVNLKAWFRRAVARRNLGHWDLARQDLEEAKRHGAGADVDAELAIVLQQLGRGPAEQQVRGNGKLETKQASPPSQAPPSTAPTSDRLRAALANPASSANSPPPSRPPTSSKPTPAARGDDLLNAVSTRRLPNFNKKEEPSSTKTTTTTTTAPTAPMKSTTAAASFAAKKEARLVREIAAAAAAARSRDRDDNDDNALSSSMAGLTTTTAAPVTVTTTTVSDSSTSTAQPPVPSTSSSSSRPPTPIISNSGTSSSSPAPAQEAPITLSSSSSSLSAPTPTPTPTNMAITSPTALEAHFLALQAQARHIPRGHPARYEPLRRLAREHSAGAGKSKSKSWRAWMGPAGLTPDLLSEIVGEVVALFPPLPSSSSSSSPSPSSSSSPSPLPGLNTDADADQEEGEHLEWVLPLFEGLTTCHRWESASLFLSREEREAVKRVLDRARRRVEAVAGRWGVS